ncbi:MAG TPA: hypothetical protein VFC31_13505 [Candidatus Limnocylindria bacterium]|nr:hypothetical protein [Candidatus Limnocylindria bacterium]
MARYDTNLAGEFYALACLHRLGITANLTLGNKKGVDIVVARKAGDAVTVEVKALAGKDYWPAQNLSATKADRHFVVLVSFDGKIDDPAMPAPSVWVVPFAEIERFIVRYPKGRIDVSRKLLREQGARYQNAWGLIEGN